MDQLSSETDFTDGRELFINLKKLFKFGILTSLINPIASTRLAGQESKNNINNGAVYGRPLRNNNNEATKSNRAPASQEIWDTVGEKMIRICVMINLYLFSKFTLYALLSFLTFRAQQRLHHRSWFLKILRYIISISGDPLADVPNICVLIYLVLGTMSFIVSSLWSLYCRRYPLDMIAVRLMLKPLGELERVDKLCLDSIEIISESLNCFEHEVIKEFGKRRSNYAKAREKLNTHSKQIRLHRLLIQDLRTSYRQFRTFSYSPKWYRILYYLYMFHIYMIISVSALIVPVVSVIILHINVVSVRCWYRLASGCYWLKLYSLPELVCFLELLAMSILLVWQSAFIYYWYFVQMFTHTRLTIDIRLDLNEICDKLKQINHHCSLEPHRLPPKTAALLIDKLILFALVKLMLFEADFEGSRKTMATIISIVELSNIAAMVCAFISNQMGGSNGLELLAFFLCWFYTNMLLISVAHVTEKLVQVRSISWSILAENTIRHRRAGTSMKRDLISVLWLKSVLTGSKMIDRNRVKIFGVPINYRVVLEVNFTVITCILLLIR